MRDRVGMVDLAPFVIFDFTGPGSRRLHPAHGGQQRRCQGRPLGVHPAAHRVGRVQGRPDHAPAGRRALSGYHRSLRRAPGQALVQPPSPRGRIGPHDRSHLGLHHHRGLGPARPATWSSRSPITTSPTRPSPTARPRRSTSARSTPGSSGSPMSAIWAGRSTSPPSRAADVGPFVGGRPGLRSRAGGRRRLRDHGPPREGLPADGGRTRERVQPGRGGARPAASQGPRLHREGGL